MKATLVSPDQYLDLCTWIVEHSGNSENHCLHSWAGETPESLASDLKNLNDIGELLYLEIIEQGRRRAALGAEFDLQEGQAWLKGPQAGPGRWQEEASGLFAALERELPNDIHTLFAHVHTGNRRAREFYRNLGFKEKETFCHVYSLAADGPLPDLPEILPGPETGHVGGFLSLYKSHFPGSYLSGEKILEGAGGEYGLFVSAAKGEVTGYCVASLSADKSTGEIEFLGVAEGHRRQGLGKTLLLNGLHWLRNQAPHCRIMLNVKETLLGARRLYQEVGFTLQYSGASLSRQDSR